MSGGYGISSADMDASRLVFVSVPNAKPRRKVAVPVPDGASWESFCSQVQNKLRLRGISSICIASSGEQVLRTDDLQDIDELHVVEAQAPPAVSPAQAAAGGNGTSYAAAAAPDGAAASTLSPPQHPQGERHRVGVADMGHYASPQQHRDADSDSEAKYTRRQGTLQRSLTRIFPSMFQPGLPVTTRDAKEGPSSSAANSGRRRRRRGHLLSLRNILAAFLLLTCLGTLLFLYVRLGAHLP